MNFNSICLACFQNTGGLNPCPHCGADAAHIQASPQHIPPGTVLNRNYLIGKAVGQGGFGITYKAWDLNAWRVVAVKEYYPAGLVTRERGLYVAPVSEEARAKLKKGVSIRERSAWIHSPMPMLCVLLCVRIPMLSRSVR